MNFDNQVCNVHLKNQYVYCELGSSSDSSEQNLVAWMTKIESKVKDLSIFTSLIDWEENSDNPQLIQINHQFTCPPEVWVFLFYSLHNLLEFVAICIT